MGIRRPAAWKLAATLFAVVVVGAVGLRIAGRVRPVTPRLSAVTCTWVAPSGLLVSGRISNPAGDTRTFAVRPTFWLVGVGQVAAGMHDYVTVPGHGTRRWVIVYGMSGTAPFGTPITRCGPYAYQADRPADD